MTRIGSPRISCIVTGIHQITARAPMFHQVAAGNWRESNAQKHRNVNDGIPADLPRRNTDYVVKSHLKRVIKVHVTLTTLPQRPRRHRLQLTHTQASQPRLIPLHHRRSLGCQNLGSKVGGPRLRMGEVSRRGRSLPGRGMGGQFLESSCCRYQ